MNDHVVANKRAASASAARRSAIQQLKFGAVLILIVAVGILWTAFFNEERVLERRYRSHIANAFEAAGHMARQIPAPDDLEEGNASSERPQTADLTNTIVFSLQSVRDPGHAIDDRLPVDRVVLGVMGRNRDIPAAYDWRPPDAINTEGDGMHSFDVERGCEHLANSRFLVLVRFVEWVDPEDKGVASLQPGLALFDTFLFDSGEESLLASRRHRIDQSGIMIAAHPSQLEEEARRKLVEAVDERIKAWLSGS